MFIKKTIVAALLAAPAALAIATPAQAQSGGIAYANPTSVVASSKAFAAANQQISTTYKAAFDQMQQRRAALETELKPLVAQLDTNKDGKVSEEEGRAAQTAKNPAIEKIRTAQTNAQTDLARLSNPAARAELFAIESVLRQYDAAQLKVVNARKINVVLSPEVFMYAPDSANISQAITAEIDKVAPTVSIQPPANWQPSRETLAIQQQIAQAAQIQAYQQAAAAQQQGAAPAAGTAPAKPAEPR
ncbi:Skp family chaperone for outer membrane proteins [Sphingomonas naasensis]|uniref:OmpH family outer membrane protein n=1 Tax=Sphingomonas naasensis TaxID=1344951 RepID=A0A4S1WR21_9SPHN|nr:OmpH family outer membrane protein [Sphingomonas naasensis]NIJ18548.1 Skp family chaperone for outer membrane proteins [Sphingomonas naasensis]TGX45799.1 OmpH family outer membrane protein [Sphingomonas naasensis]